MTRHIRLDDPASARLDCDAFARLLADWLEGDLRPALREAADRHRDACAACAALVADLDDLRAGAAALPPIEPPRDLWAGIEARIGTRVVALPVAPARAVGTPGAPPSWWPQGLRAAAAALLVAGLGAAGWVATRGDRDAGIVASAPATPSVAPSVMPAVASPVAPPPTAATADAAPPPARVVASAAPARAARAAAAPPASPLDLEIATLRRTLEARRGSLDTATVRAIETNIAILDGAIRDSRAALAEEPTSQLLHAQLASALDAKLELMRTAVILSGDD